ncbi:MAG: LysM peptidoglycan-binding domain-containing protein [Bacteroidales bacterium]|jgi:RHS repeat-associated protein|nr:LysM peptidoglycan-binding domain-containing protein [Bacteroidales bacterium]
MKNKENISKSDLSLSKHIQNTEKKTTKTSQNLGRTDNANDNSKGTAESKQTSISLPTGGGAIRGIGEKFQANPVTGTASFNVPITISEGRGDFTPQLSLNYDSGSGNSVFGIGWSIGLSNITRKTDKGLPEYHDIPDSESDIFILSGTEDLVPVMNSNGSRKKRIEENYTVYYYAPRTEGLFASIERWVDNNNSDDAKNNCHWRTVSRDNIVSIYGLRKKNAISDPSHPDRIFSWLIEESWDAKGNIMQFEYVVENTTGVTESSFEYNRINNERSFTNKYLKRVKYGNKAMRNSENPINSEYDGGFHLNLVFDYGDHNETNPLPEADVEWASRKDPFSSYRSGFDIRTYRLCKRILMFHDFEHTENGIGTNPVLVRSTILEYDTDPAFSILKKITHKGHNGNNSETLPPLEFKYTTAEIGDKLKAVPEELLNDIPSGTDNSNYIWSDLYSEGISGILHQNDHAWYFKPNLGDIRFQNEDIDEPVPVFENIRKVVPKPAAVTGRYTSYRLDDINSDNYPELIIQNHGLNGYYSMNEDGKWENFKNFKNIPNIDYTDDNLRFMDLSGDGLSDIVISHGGRFDIYFSEGKEGYGNYRKVECSTEAGNAPVLVFSDVRHRIFLADMSGDGLTDIVKITGQSVCYWPNTGYGRFGEKIIMGSPPLFDSFDQFDTRYIHLADVDGTGTTDILYISYGKIRYFKNLSGNQWEEQQTSGNLVYNYTKYNYIQVVDLLGNGTQCVVFSSSLPTEIKNMFYLELTSGIKPFLLNYINNNMGAERKLHYAPSTKFYIKDKLQQKPWITKLPFVVHVLEKVEIIDNVGEKHFTSKYTYHHGYYDTAEREFRGFGMVEQLDTETFKEWSENNNNITDMNYSPPVLTKTWFHTGFYKNRKSISKQYAAEYYQYGEDWKLPDTKFPGDLTGEESREACRALKGNPLRIEVYARDNTYEQNIPYTITENSYLIKTIQEKDKNKHAVFSVLPQETLTINYERNDQDFRVVHSLNLEYDEYDNPLKQAKVAYKRTHADAIAGQNKTLVTITKNSFFNSNENSGFHRIGVPVETINFETEYFQNRSNKIRISDFSNSEINLKKIQHQYTYYYNEDCSAPLEPGEVASHALVYRTETLTLTQELIEKFCDHDLENNLYPESGAQYNILENVEYINLTEEIIKSYLTENDEDEEENETKLNYILRNEEYWIPSTIVGYDHMSFYMPVSETDQFDNITTITYDEYKLLPIEIIAPLNHATSIENNYYHLQPTKITDPNGNVTQVALNTLGMVTAQTVYGKNPGEGDVSLDSPTIKYEYNLDNWYKIITDPETNEQVENHKPVYVYTKTKTEHGTDSKFIETFEYTDGLGNLIMVKTTAEDKKVINEENQIIYIPQFLTSGKTIYDNKGNIVKQYEPWFSDNPDYESETETVQHGVTPIMHYDPLGRLIKTDFPDGTTSRVEFNAWQQSNFDQNDCDENSPHYNTPQVVYISPLGTAFKTVDKNTGFGNDAETTQTLDILEQVLFIEDACGRIMTKNLYDLAGQLIFTYNIDSGPRRILYNAAQQPVYKWDSRNHQIKINYDELMRPTDTYLISLEFEKLVEKIVYGTPGADPLYDYDNNQIGKIKEIYAQDGKTIYNLYDFKGNILTLTKQFAEDYAPTLDYTNFEDVILQTEIFEILTDYDALNRPVRITQPDGTIVENIYNKGGLLKAVTHNNQGYITDILYNARGQREDIYYGNGSKTKYEYNPNNFRLTRLLTTKNTGQDILQDLNYEYDSVGNIVKQTDNAQLTYYFSNSAIEPVCTYEYDALYRLIKATGREKEGLTDPGWEDFQNDLPVPNTDSNALQNYTHKFSYDELGNILSDNWKEYVYDTQTNRLLKHEEEQTLDDYFYDNHGNIISMTHLPTMEWDYKDQLISTTNGTFTSYYNYDNEGNRSRKVVEKTVNNIIVREERYYIGGYEIYKHFTNLENDYERETIKIADDIKTFVLIETKSIIEIEDGEIEKTPEPPIIRYQYDNHLGSACLELDAEGNIISYEEYHPFGTTSYRAGNDIVKVSLKRYKYCGKERDEETGLYYYGARYYAAWLCRFVSVDPLQHEYPHYTPYQYAGNKPITYIDLDGLEEAKRDFTTEPPDTYTIQKGDTFWDLANKWGLEQGVLESLNPTLNPTNLQIGQEIISTPDYPVNAPFTQTYTVNTTETQYIEQEQSRSFGPSLATAGAFSLSDGLLPIGEIAGLLLLAGTAAYFALTKAPTISIPIEIPKVETKTEPSPFNYVTYTKTHSETGFVYVGRSSGYGSPESIVKSRDINHHKTAEGYGEAVLSNSLQSQVLGGFNYRLNDPAYWAIRGSEQLQIEHYRGLGISGNTRNGISDFNQFRDKYINAARKLLGH